MKPTDVTCALTAKGFVEERSRRHIFFRISDNDGTYLAQTHISHNRKEIGNDLQRSMAHQMNLTLSQFKQFVSCTITEAQYRSILRDKEV